MNTSHWVWMLRRLTRRIWFRASVFSLASVATALLAMLVAPYIPPGLQAKIGADAVDGILGIIASSMLAVTTFSLTVMVSAFSAASSNVTPRAAKLVVEDSTTQNVLATFLGSFLFSLVGLVALSAGVYGEQGRVVLLAVTIVIIALVVVTLVRWIDHLSELGRVDSTTRRVEQVATDAMRDRRETPYLGGAKLDGVPANAFAIHAKTIGYVEHIDIGALSRIAEAVGGDRGRVFVTSIPGAFVDGSTPLAWVQNLDLAEAETDIRGCFSVGDVRSFDQDPRFGICVLSEIASRALSPGINDPGTAIDVIGRLVRTLSVWLAPRQSEAAEAPNVFVQAIEPNDLFDDAFGAISTYCAGSVEVGIRLQKALASLARLGDDRYEAAARSHSVRALERAEAALPTGADIRAIRTAASGLLGEAASGGA